MTKALLPRTRTFTRTFCPLLQLQLIPKGFYRRGAEREEVAEAEQEETQHKGTEAQRSDRIKVKNRHGGA